VEEESERLVVRMARENPRWGYDRIVGAMANLGYQLSDQTVGNLLRRHDIPPAPQRKQTGSWKDFIRAHMAVLVATDFFTVEVLTLRGWRTYYGLFFIQLESRRIGLAGVTRHPDEAWMEQMARNGTMEDSGFLNNRRYLMHDRDRKYCQGFRAVIRAGGIDPIGLAGQKSESERLCGTLGQVGQGRMFVEADPVERGFSAPSATPLPGPLS
jgi:putative transposase